MTGGSKAFLGMVMVNLAQVGSFILTKVVLTGGISNYVLAFYSNALSTLIVMVLPVLPSIFRRSENPSVTFSMLWRIFLLALIGCTDQVSGYIGLHYSSPTVGAAIHNLLPAFSFILAIIFRMEKLEWGSSSSQAKSMGTLVSIAGAFTVTLYKGPTIIMIPTPVSSSSIMMASPPFLFSGSPPSTWILGGFFFASETFMISLWYIWQASIIKKYPALLINLSYYSFFLTIQSLVICLIAEKDFSAWRLNPDMELITIVYTAVGFVFRIGMTTWCLRRTGPLYVSMFKPLGIAMAAVLGVIFLGDSLYVGSVVGATVIVCGFYAVMWGEASEDKKGEDIVVGSSSETPSGKVPLLQKKTTEDV